VSGLGTLLRAQARDLGQIATWCVGLAFLYWSQAISIESLYRTQDELDRAAASMAGNAAFVAMTGPARALDTVGGQVAWQSTAIGAVLVALMVMLLVGRHTRAAEEAGRDELIRSGPVSRFAPVAAAVAGALAASVLVGASVAAALIAYRLAWADSVALGLGLAVTGWFFAAVTLVAVQLTSSVRTAYGLVGVVLATAYLARAVGDVRVPALSWASPIGWYQAMHAFSGLRWWPALLPLLATAVALALGCWLLVRRDHGCGVLAERAGPARGGRTLRSGLGLAWRLHRATTAAWAVGLFVAGLGYGSIGEDVEDLIGDSATSRALFATDGVDVVAAFQATSLLMLALIASGHTVAAALRGRTEEEAGRLAPLLVAGLSRTRWWDGQAVVVLLGSAVVLAAAGAGLGTGYGLATGRWHEPAVLLPAELAYLAPAAVLAGWAWLWVALAPRWASMAWTGPGVALAVGYFGELLDLPGWLRACSPYEHLAAVPDARFSWWPVLATAGVAVLLAAGARRAFAARDLR